MSVSLKQSYDIEYNGTVNVSRMDLFIDTAADLTGLTTFDTITLLQGSTAEDISTGDKYMMQTGGTWVKQPSAGTFSNVYTKTEIDAMIANYYTKTEADDLFVWITVTITTDTLPLSFISDGSPLTAWSISGNGQQNGTPTPDNPVMPEFVGVRTGNLFDKSTPALYAHSTLGQVDAWAYSAESTGTTLRIPCDANTQYALSIGSAIGNTIFRISEISTDEVPIEGGSGGIVCHTIINGDAINSYAFTTASDSKYILFQVNTNVTTAALNTLMLNLGSTALPYEPYGYKIPLTCAGQTVPVYLGQTQTVRRVNKYEFTGTEALQTSGSGNARFFYMTISGAKSWETIMSDRYANANIASTTEVIGVAMTGNSLFRIRPDITSTVEEYKQYLAAQYANGTPVTIWYVLATEQTGIVNEPLMKIGDYADELTTTTPIPTAKGSNTLSVDTTVQPSEMTITGKIRSE